VPKIEVARILAIEVSHSEGQRLVRDAEEEMDVRRHLTEGDADPGHPTERCHEASSPVYAVDVVKEIGPIVGWR
jgi:hypothetical protein